MSYKRRKMTLEEESITIKTEIDHQIIKNEDNTIFVIKEVVAHECDILIKEEPLDVPDLKFEILSEDDDPKVFSKNNSSSNKDENVNNLFEGTTKNSRRERYVCHSCGSKFTSKKKYDNHFIEMECKKSAAELSASTDIKNVICPLCSKILTTERSLRTHIWKNHDKAQPFVCNGCSKTFVTRSSLQKHLKNNEKCRTEEATNVVPSKSVMEAKCPICDVTCINPTTFNAHMADCHKIEKTYPCICCGNCFLTEEEFEIHLTTYAECAFENITQTKEYPKCALCNASYIAYLRLAEHMRERHGNENLLACKSCDLRFALRFQLNVHLKYSEKCSRSQEEIANLQQRQQKSKSPNKNESDLLKCDFCCDTFKTYKTLKLHMNTVHEGFNPFTCSHCKESFKCLNDFELHLLEESPICKNDEQLRRIDVHKNGIKAAYEEILPCKEELRTCILCEKTYVNIYGLQAHMFTIHNDIEPFSCKTCGQRFSMRHKLRRHFQTEPKCVNSEEVIILPESHEFAEMDAANILDSNDPEYRTCRTCNKTYSTLNALRCHMTTIHRGIKQFKCEKCELAFVTKIAYHTHLKRTTNCRKPHEDLKERFCRICKTVFTTTVALRLHWLRKHKDNNFFSCDFCKSTFKYKRELLLHIDNMNCSTAVQIKEEPSLDIESDDESLMDDTSENGRLNMVLN